MVISFDPDSRWPSKRIQDADRLLRVLVTEPACRRCEYAPLIRQNLLDGHAVIIENHPPGHTRIRIEPAFDFKAALMSSGNRWIISEIRRAIDGVRQWEAMLQPLLVQSVHMVGQAPGGRQHHPRRRDCREDHSDRFHASRREDRCRGLAFGVGNQHAVDVEEDDGWHG